MTDALAGLLVIELATGLQGPAAAGFLADLGADVIKVEPPEGDASRFHKGVNNFLPEATPGAQFIGGSRGKRSVSLDLHSELGKEVVYRLAERADVFVSNYREDALNRMGVGYEDIRSRNPKIVYAVANGFGPLGKEAGKGMVDGAAQARGGIISLLGDPSGPPTMMGFIFADLAGAAQLALGIMTALVAKGRLDIGQKVSTSAYGAQIWLLMWELVQSGLIGHSLTRQGPHHPNIPGGYGVYETAGGGSIFLAFAGTEESWQSFCTFAGMPEFGIDERWNSLQKRMGMGNDAEGKIASLIRAPLRTAFKSKPLEEWVEFFESEPDIVYSRVFTYDDVLNDPQAIANGYIVERNIPHAGVRKVVGNPVTFSETPVTVADAIPELGQHTEEVMLELEFDWDEITRLNDGTRAALRQKFIDLGQEPPF